MNFYAVEYVYKENCKQIGDEVRPAHREFLTGLFESGVLVFAGSWILQPEDTYTGSTPGAWLMLKANSAEDVLKILNDDPYLEADYISERRINHWNPVFSPFSD